MYNEENAFLKIKKKHERQNLGTYISNVHTKLDWYSCECDQ